MISSSLGTRNKGGFSSTCGMFHSMRSLSSPISRGTYVTLLMAYYLQPQASCHVQPRLSVVSTVLSTYREQTLTSADRHALPPSKPFQSPNLSHHISHTNTPAPSASHSSAASRSTKQRTSLANQQTSLIPPLSIPTNESPAHPLYVPHIRTQQE